MSLRDEIGVFRAFQSFRRQFKRPRDNERDGKPDDNCEHNKAHCPIRNFEKRKDLGGNLNEQPTDDRVRDRDLVNVAPLQLGEEVVDLHYFASDLGAITF